MKMLKCKKRKFDDVTLQYSMGMHSVANAVVYLPNWTSLKSPTAGQKLLGRWPKNWATFIHLPTAVLFSSNMPVSCQFREFLSLFNVQEHSFRQFQGLRHLGEQSILIFHLTRKSAIVFPPNQVILIILQLKSTQIWKIGLIITYKNWATLKSLAAGKKANLPLFGALKFLQHWGYK